MTWLHSSSQNIATTMWFCEWLDCGLCVVQHHVRQRSVREKPSPSWHTQTHTHISHIYIHVHTLMLTHIHVHLRSAHTYMYTYAQHTHLQISMYRWRQGWWKAPAIGWSGGETPGEIERVCAGPETWPIRCRRAGSEPTSKASSGIECGGRAWGPVWNDLSFASNRHKTMHTHLCDAEKSQFHFPP